MHGELWFDLDDIEAAMAPYGASRNEIDSAVDDLCGLIARWGDYLDEARITDRGYANKILGDINTKLVGLGAKPV